MSVLFILLPLSLLMAGAALAAFIWATKKGQFDDLDAMGEKLISEDRIQNFDSGKPSGNMEVRG